MTQNDRSQTVRLTTATKKRLEAVRDLLEEAIQEQFSEGLARASDRQRSPSRTPSGQPWICSRAS